MRRAQLNTNEKGLRLETLADNTSSKAVCGLQAVSKDLRAPNFGTISLVTCLPA